MYRVMELRRLFSVCGRGKVIKVLMKVEGSVIKKVEKVKKGSDPIPTGRS